MTPAERDNLGRLMGDVDARVERFLWRKISDGPPPPGAPGVLVRFEMSPMEIPIKIVWYDLSTNGRPLDAATHWRYIDPPPGCAE